MARAWHARYPDLKAMRARSAAVHQQVVAIAKRKAAERDLAARLLLKLRQRVPGIPSGGILRLEMLQHTVVLLVLAFFTRASRVNGNEISENLFACQHYILPGLPGQPCSDHHFKRVWRLNWL